MKGAGVQTFYNGGNCLLICVAVKQIEALTLSLRC